MDNLSICRICLSGNVNMYSLLNTKLQDVYEKLTAIPKRTLTEIDKQYFEASKSSSLSSGRTWRYLIFYVGETMFQTEDRKPLRVCYLCLARLQSCYRLLITSLRSDKLLTQMLLNNQVTSIQDSKTLTLRHPLVHLSYVPPTDKITNEKEIKEEDIIVEAEDDITNKELNSTEDKIKTEDMNDEDTSNINDIQEKDILTTTYAELNIEFDIKTENSDQDTDDDIQNNLDTDYSIPTTELSDTILESANNSLNRIEMSHIETGAPADCEAELCVEDEDVPYVVSSTLETETTLDNSIQYTLQMQNLDQIIRQRQIANNVSVQDNIIQDHYVQTSERPYRCDVCKKCFRDKAYLFRHARIHTGEKPYKCDTCDKRFSERSSLSKHILVHTGEKPYKCDMCEKCYQQKRSLLQHICLIHMGGIPFKCDMCNKFFSEKFYLLRHMRIHAAEKPHRCDTCGKCFSEKSYLARHIRSHIGLTSYKCDRCDKSFIEKGRLTKHIRVHTGEKPYRCDLCSRCYTEKAYLAKHIRIHTGKKPYKCELCDKLFNQQSHLKQHVHVHMNEKPFKCHICSNRYNIRQTLTRHIRSVHGE